MKKWIFILASCFLFVLVSCSTDKMSSLPTYESLNTISEDYTLEDAKADDCVVFEDLSLITGESVWKRFLKQVEKNQTALVRIVTYYSDESSMYITDLNYADSVYTVSGKNEITKEYQYLNHYTEKAKEGSDYSELDCYILVNEQDVTYEQLEQSLASSFSDDYIDQYHIYKNFIE